LEFALLTYYQGLRDSRSIDACKKAMTISIVFGVITASCGLVEEECYMVVFFCIF